jgi:CRISPR-associated protein Csm2
MNVDTEKLTQIIQHGDTDTLIEYAETVGNRAGKADLGTTQIRNIYGMVKQLQAQAQPDYDQLKLLIPKLKYAAAKQSALGQLTAVLSESIMMVEGDSDKFKRFCDFFEAIVAYHYAYTKGKGGK